MRSVVFLGIYLYFLFRIFIDPFIGVLLWYWLSLMNPHRVIYGFAAGLNYALGLRCSILPRTNGSTEWTRSRPTNRTARSARVYGCGECHGQLRWRGQFSAAAFTGAGMCRTPTPCWPDPGSTRSSSRERPIASGSSS